MDVSSDNSVAKLSKNIIKVARGLFTEEERQREFLDAIQRGDSSLTAVVWLKESDDRSACGTSARPEWLPEWIDVAAVGQRPGKLPEHERGDIYCMDLSSTFACSPFSEIETPIGVALDVCASPGGKGIVARRYLSPDLLVGNEVIGKRTAQLISNYKRCGIDPAIVTSLDPEVLGRELAGCADLVIVDAPCSGQSLVLKGMAAPGAFHPATIGMNERRQRRILAHSAKSVAAGGYLLYATCTFSREENEGNLEWFLKNFSEFSTVPVEALAGYRSHLSHVCCYRLWPNAGKGAGAFCALLRRSGEVGQRERITSDAVAAKLRTAWRSPARFISEPKGALGSAPSKRDNRRKDDAKRRSKRYERHKAKRIVRDFT